jgi:hypothetical protein
MDEASALQRLDETLHHMEEGRVNEAILSALDAGRLLERIGVRRFEPRAREGLRQQRRRAKGTETTKKKGRTTQRLVRDAYRARRTLRPSVDQTEIVKDVAEGLGVSVKTVRRHAPSDVRDALDLVVRGEHEGTDTDKA